MELQKTVLDGSQVRLEPLARQHLVGLAEAIRDGELWQIPVTFVPHPNALDSFLEDAEAAFRQGRELAFATIDKTRERVVGSTRFMGVVAAHKRLEIGFTFLAESSQRTRINTEAKYLMLRHAFEHWQCHRIELITDVLNTKSRRAIGRIGARQEAILRSHMLMRDGRIRDSALFSIIASEWPEVKAALEAKLDTSALPPDA